MDYALAIAIGVALAACSGVRAFLPLFVSGVLARTGHLPLHDKLDFVASTPALVALGVAALCELVADKFPAVDHALDVAQTPVRTVAGMIVAAAAFAPFPTWAAVLLGIVAGGGVALGVHATKATVRGASTVTTAGLANPVISIVEDVGVAAVAILSPLLAVFAFVFAALALVLVFFGARAVLRKLRARRAAASATAQR